MTHKLAEKVDMNVGKALIQIDAEGKTESGLFLVGDQSGPKKGTVVVAGAPRTVDGVPTSLALISGDRVLVDDIGSTKLKIEGHELLLIRLEDVVARLK